MKKDLEKKINQAINLLQTIKGDVELCYSGGKDSDVILELAKMAGINFRAIYKNTTIDPKGTIAHCKRNGVDIVHPKMTFFDIIEKKGFPTRRARFCCAILKEYKILGQSIQGIRRCESQNRAKRYKEPIICKMYNKQDHVNVYLPILNWTDNDVKEFIKERNIQCHPIYYDKEGKFNVKKRLGCVGCPLPSDRGKRDFLENPKMLKSWMKAMQKRWNNSSNTLPIKKKFNNIYELITHNLFFKTYEDFRLSRDGMFEIPNYKELLEEYFKINL